jgi:purine-nucleoside phosphorylase
VAGHSGALLVGTLAGRPVLGLAGRFHMYEGHDAALSAFPVRVAHALGTRVYVASNAAGGIRRTFRPGDLMAIADHLNLTGRNPLVGPVQPGDERFPDMSVAYDPALRAQLHAAAQGVGVPLHDGVYAGLLGPTFETPAEVRMLERLGADAVGMSTVAEVIVARALGMRVAAVSCITNQAAGIASTLLHHGEVMDTGARVGPAFEAVVTRFVRDLA